MFYTLLAQLHNPVLPDIIGGGKTGASVDKGGAALGSLITNLVGALFVAGFLLTFLFVIMGGFTWITAGGDKTKLEKARDEITHAIIGLIVVGASYAIALLISNFFGLDLAKLPIPTIGQ
jgi:hypothetical protein